MNSKILLLLVLIIAFPCHAQQAQVSEKQDTAGRGAAKQQLPDVRRQALEAVYFEIERAKDYGNAREKVAVWTDAADILWLNDPQTSRKLLRDGFIAAKSATAPTSDKDEKYIAAIKNDLLQRKLRTEILLVAQKRDIKLVKELIDSFDEEDVKKLDELHNSPAVLGSSSFAKRQIASFAALLARTDPKKAVEYAVASLGFGFPQELGEVFRSLANSNPIYARQLYSEAASYFIADNSLNLYDALILTSYLNMTVVSESDREITKQVLSRALLRQRRVWQGIQEQRIDGQMLPEVVLNTSRELYKLYAIHFPERLGEIDSFTRQVSMQLARPDFAYDPAPLETQDDAEILLEKAEKETIEENKDAYYLEAALAFALKKNFTRALNAVSNAKDDVKREAVLNVVRRKQAESLIDVGDLLEASKVIEKIQEPELRTEITVIFAKKARENKDPLMATQLVADTQHFLEKSFSSVQDARAYLWLASAYTASEPLRGFDLMNSAIKRANQAKELVEIEGQVKIVHLGGKSKQAVLIGNSKGDFRPGFRILAKQNFTQMLSLAENFENKFFRGVAILAGSSQVLTDENRRTNSRRRASVTTN